MDFQLLMDLAGGAAIAVVAAIALEDEDQQQQQRVKKRRPRSVWVRPWLQKREQLGICAKLLPELRSGDHSERKLFKMFVRMCEKDFDHLLSLVEPHIAKQDTNMRRSIRPGARLALTLNYLATGNSFKSLAYVFRIPQCTITTIIPEVLDAIYNALAPTHLKVCFKKWLSSNIAII